MTWTSVEVAQVRLGLSRDGGEAWEQLAGPIPAALGSFAWTADAGGVALPQLHCLIRVSDAQDETVSDTSGELTIWSGVLWYVAASADAGGDGRSWGTAFRHPRATRSGSPTASTSGGATQTRFSSP